MKSQDIVISKNKKRYDELFNRLEELGIERQNIIRSYIKDLETEKVNAIRVALGLSDNTK